MLPRRASQIAIWVLGAIGLGVSLLLLWEYTHDAAGLCGPDGGCAAVRHSRWAEILGVPTPAYGVLFFSMLIATVVAGRRARMLLTVIALSGAASAIALIAIQWLVIGEFCRLCLVADGAALAAVPFVLLAAPGEGFGTRGRLAGGVIAFSVGLAALGTVGDEGEGQTPADTPPPVVVDPLPAPIAAEQRDGQVTIVEFVDYECPHCRRLHKELLAVQHDVGRGLRVVRKNVPLPAHEHAIDAARCAICAGQIGEGEAEEVAHALMDAEDVSVAGCKTIALSLGLDVPRIQTCLASDQVIAAIEADVHAAQACGVERLPTFFIGNERFEGFRPASVLRASIERARKNLHGAEGAEK
jgi:uncharacterized membrane protein/protein-disulfide isomerase